MAVRGGGRGALLKLLEARSNASIENSASTESNSNKSSEGMIDSGFGHSNPYLASAGVSSSTQGGRGRIIRSMLSTTDTAPKSASPDSSIAAPVQGRGRASLIHSLQSNSSSEDSGLLVCRGRGSLGIGISNGARKIAENGVKAVTEDLKKVDVSSSEVKCEEMTVALSLDEAEMQPVTKRGTAGVEKFAVCNYVRLESEPDKGVFEYEVRFQPNIDSRHLRLKFLNEHRDKFGGTKTFDGIILYLPILLPDRVTTYTSINPGDQTPVQIIVTYKRKKSMKDCMQLYNILFDRIMKALNYVRFDRKQYDPSQPKMIPQWKLEIWPGYVTAVDEYEGGLMLCCDVSHRLLCQTTVYETLNDAYNAGRGNFHENAKKALLGSVVLTRYNNRTYRIDDINFNANPLSTFQCGDREVSYVDYYRSHYNIEIKDHKQPLLVSIKKQRIANQDTPQEMIYYIVPEICYLTGIRDDLRSDFKVMRDIATHTRVSPNQRVQALEKFYRNVNDNKEAREILSNWGLRLGNQAERLKARQLEEETILFARKSFPAGVNADFSKYATSNELLEVVHFTNWALIHTQRDSGAAKNFVECLEKNSNGMGINVTRPKVYVLQNDRTDTYVTAIRNAIKPDTQIVVTICPTSRDDRYAAIKKICCSELPVASQVINARTLMNESKNRSIVQKIALQMNCKLGGTLWSIKIPFKGVMICGVDSYHEAGNRGNSVAAFVASLNTTYTKWYSRAVVQTKKEEIVNGLCASLRMALQAYEKLNNELPVKIIIFRDGVGDGQLKLCADYEIPLFEDACKFFKGYEAKITFVVVQKRINTRIFAEMGKDYGNPNPGFVLDHTVTRRYMYDFFLISQSVRQGTVSPSHFIVVKDASDFKPDVIQRLAYKLCFLYYNWPGTVRVPACCQYAHKLAYLVGQSVKRETAEKLANTLFYL